MYNLGVKRMEVEIMKRDYKILVNNKTYCTAKLEWAIEIAKRESLVGGRVSVLKDGKKRNDIRNHNVCMLHVELRTENCHLDGWKLGEDRDKKLLDPTPYLKLI
jgi:hypothetical protein